MNCCLRARQNVCGDETDGPDHTGAQQRTRPAQGRNHGRRSIRSRSHPAFADFQAAIVQTRNQIATVHAEDFSRLMTLDFHDFDSVSRMAA